MKQDDLFTPTLEHARENGAFAELAVADKAKRITSFDLEGARAKVLELLKCGPRNGEDLVQLLKAYGFRGHDDRCFGAVFSVLAKRKAIRCIDIVQRRRGHGTAGCRVWERT